MAHASTMSAMLKSCCDTLSAAQPRWTDVGCLDDARTRLFATIGALVVSTRRRLCVTLGSGVSPRAVGVTLACARVGSRLSISAGALLTAPRRSSSTSKTRPLRVAAAATTLASRPYSSSLSVTSLGFTRSSAHSSASSVHSPLDAKSLGTLAVPLKWRSMSRLATSFL